ncbi:MAG: bifunctional serine/threonine-protein kinase/formylglycine-generating enzyme family protein [Planctomycetes bacterium]|nr:bifunctional serine/threonine-protein kinase/formylglycine-generating enzyme family protein [Planctomycetota bacterium]
MRDDDPIVQAALARGFLTAEQLEAARRLEAELAAAGGSPGLRALLAQRFLTPAQVQALRQPPPSGDALGRTAEDARVLRPVELRPGAEVGGYQIERLLGRGGMGAVYAGVDPRTGAPVAIKVLAAADPQSRARFRREGVAQAAVDRHPNVLRVLGAGEQDGAPFLVMELAEGGDLAARLKQGPLPPREAARLVAQLAHGLAHVHRAGILHRDLKPQNVLFDAAGTPRLVDFGVARVRGEEALTRTGDLVGTPAYMAPEQADGARRAIDERTDVYGLGAVLYHAVTGRPPFDGGAAQTIRAVLMDPPTPPSQEVPGLPPDVDRVVLKALAKDPADRYPSAQALARDLERLARGEAVLGRDEEGARRRGRTLRWALAAGGLLALLGGGGAALWRTWPHLAGYFEAPPPPEEPARGRLEAAHPRERTRLGWLSVRVEVEGGARAGRLLVGDRVVASGGPGWRFQARAPLALGHNVVRLEVQDGEGSWRRAGDALRVERDRAFDPPPPEEVRDLLGRTLRLDEVEEVYRAADGSVLLYVPPGEFVMGSDECVYRMSLGEELGEHDTRVSAPPHPVSVSAFLVGKHEVSWRQLERWREATGADVPARPPRFDVSSPAVDVTWHQARAYCAWAGLALPTEAQWEWAARGPEARRYPWGDQDPAPGGAGRAVFGLDRRTGAPRGVNDDMGGASWVGALHMSGNAWEWVEDLFAPFDGFLRGGDGPRRDPCHRGDEGEPPFAHRVIRGGSWRTKAEDVGQCHAAFRRAATGDLTKGASLGQVPDSRDHELGFRVALPLR